MRGRARQLMLPVAMIVILVGVGGLLLTWLRSQTALIETVNKHEGLAAWVQAMMSIVTIATGFVILMVQNAWERRSERENCRGRVRLMAAVAESCDTHFSNWIGWVTDATGPVGRAKSQPHLLVATEGLMFSDVGNARCNQLMIELRLVIQDFWWQIETAEETLQGKHPPGMLVTVIAEMRDVRARARAIADELLASAGQPSRNWPADARSPPRSVPA